MHTAAGSWWNEFIEPGNYLLYPQPTQSVTWLPVDQDQPLVKLYGPENHLHRSVRHMGDGSEYTSTPSSDSPEHPQRIRQLSAVPRRRAPAMQQDERLPLAERRLLGAGVAGHAAKGSGSQAGLLRFAAVCEPASAFLRKDLYNSRMRSTRRRAEAALALFAAAGVVVVLVVAGGAVWFRLPTPVHDDGGGGAINRGRRAHGPLRASGGGIEAPRAWTGRRRQPAGPLGSRRGGWRDRLGRGVRLGRRREPHADHAAHALPPGRPLEAADGGSRRPSARPGAPRPRCARAAVCPRVSRGSSGRLPRAS